MDWNAIWQQIDARIDRAVARTRGAARGFITAASGGSRRLMASMEVLEGERLEGVEVMLPFGFKAFDALPPTGTECIVLQVGGRGGHYVALAMSGNPWTPPLSEGDACIYSSTSALVKVTGAGEVEISTPSGGTILVDTAGNVTINGGVQGVARVGDTVTITGTCEVGGVPGTINASGVIASGSATVRSG